MVQIGRGDQLLHLSVRAFGVWFDQLDGDLADESICDHLVRQEAASVTSGPQKPLEVIFAFDYQPFTHPPQGRIHNYFAFG